MSRMSKSGHALVRGLLRLVLAYITKDDVRPMRRAWSNESILSMRRSAEYTLFSVHKRRETTVSIRFRFERVCRWSAQSH